MMKTSRDKIASALCDRCNELGKMKLGASDELPKNESLAKHG